MKIIVLVSFLLLSKHFAFAQNKNAVQKDSIAVWELRKIFHPLGLDSTQGFEFLLAHKVHFNELDNIAELNTEHDKRKLAIEESKKAFNSKLKIILTKEQFERYKIEQQKTRQQFIKKQGDKRLKVVDVNDDNL